MQEALTQHPLTVSNLKKSFGKHQVLRGLDFRLEAAAIHGLVGLNGAGKTTTLQCILGLLPFDEGAVSVLGRSPGELYQCRGAVAVVFDEPCLHPHLTVSQTLQHAALLTGANRSELPALEALLGIQRYHDFKLRDLSLGNRRRASIAAALVGSPSLVILDEPFNGLDAGGVDDVLGLIKQLNQERGISFLLASHQLSYLERICSHMAVLHAGRVVSSGPIAELLAGGKPRLRLVTGQPQEAQQVLSAMSGVELHQAARVQESSGLATMVCELNDLDSAAVNRLLVAAGIEVHELRLERRSLDSLFRELTGGAACEMA